MPGTTPKLGLRYPLATEAPDGPGGFLALATDVDNAVKYDYSNAFVTGANGASFDDQQGLNFLIRLGALRILSFSFFNAAGISPSVGPFATIAAGHRPQFTVYGGGTVLDNNAKYPAGFTITAQGALYVDSWYPDAGADGKVQAARGTLSWYATA